ncbi:MAG: hypothetical protein GY845_16660 [Planctomycetes bacterium]|nr:hypothetical protein [Planctomycetota bacterium]
MKYTYQIGLLLLRKGSIIALLSTIIMSSCKTFDPRPYQESLEKARTINEQTKGYQNRWHDGLIKHLEALHEQYLEILKAKLKQQVFDNLIKNNEAKEYAPISIYEQDIFFPIQGNRTLARESYQDEIREIISNHSFEYTVAGSTKSRDLIDMHIEEKSNTAIYTNLSAAEKQLFESGISKLQEKIVDIPFIQKQQQDFDRLIKVIEDQKKFNIELANQHSQFEQELINALQGAASALESNLWLTQIGSKAIEKINILVGNALSESQPKKEETNGTE